MQGKIQKETIIRIAFRVFLFLLMAALTALLITLLMGKPEAPAETSKDASRVSEPDEPSSESAAESVNSAESSITVPEESETEPPETSGAVIASGIEAEGEGWARDAGVYEAENNRFLLCDLTALGKNISAFTLKTAMGYLQMADGATDRLFAFRNNAAEEVTSVTEGYTLTTKRDAAGNPLFSKDSAWFTLTFLDGAWAMLPSDYDERLDARGFDCELPSYVGIQDEVAKKYYAGGWGYRSSTRAYVLASPAYTEAFAYGSDGIGCLISVADGEAKLLFYDTQYHMISARYYPPVTREKESVGFFYFDHGMTRVREKTATGYLQRLMYADGTLAVLPYDYTISGYSDGMVLMARNGKYGFLSSALAWTVQPDLLEASPYAEGLASVRTADGTAALLDRSGKALFSGYTAVSSLSDGLLLCQSENGWQVWMKVRKTNSDGDLSQNTSEAASEIDKIG